MRSLAVLLPLLLIGCTNAHPTITRLFDIDGPAADQSTYITNYLPSVIDIQGKCFHINSELQVRFDNQPWQNVSSILDSSQDNDLNCDDGNFSIHILSSAIGLSTVTPNVTLFFKQKFTGDESLESQVAVRYVNTIQALLLNAPSERTGIDASFSVGGVDVTTFKYKLGRGITCEDESSYSSAQPLGNLNLDLSPLGDGAVTLCLLGENSNQTQNTPTTFQWTVDSSIPGDIVLSNLPNTYDRLRNYSVGISSTNAVTYKAKIANTLADCSENAGFEEYSINESFNILIESAQENSNLYLCVLAKNALNNWTNVKIYSWTQDMTAPSAPTGNLSSYNLSDPTNSPDIHFNSIANYGSPLSTYSVRIFQGSTEIVSRDFPVSGAISFNSLSLADGTYKVYAKVKDLAGNISSETLIGSWLLDTTTPTAVASVSWTPYSLNKSATFHLTFTDNVAVSSAQAWLLDSNHQVVAGPQTIASGIDFNFNTVLDRNKLYYLKYQIRDTSGNTYSSESLSYTTANCAAINPNDSSLMIGVCDEVNSALGWKMQGGVVLGIDPVNPSKILVVPANIAAETITGDWENQSSAVVTQEFLNLLTGINQAELGVEAFLACKDQNTGGQSDWFLPRENQMTLLICNSNFNNKSLTDPVPELDPYCASSGRSSTFSLNQSSRYWTSTSYSSSDAIAVDKNAQFSPRNKNANASSVCIRRFSRIY